MSRALNGLRELAPPTARPNATSNILKAGLEEAPFSPAQESTTRTCIVSFQPPQGDSDRVITSHPDSPTELFNAWHASFKHRVPQTLRWKFRIPDNEVEDVEQMVWEKVWKKLPRCRCSEDSWPWLKRILRSVAIDFLRKRKSQDRIANEHRRQLGSAARRRKRTGDWEAPPAPPTAAISDEAREAVIKAVDELNPADGIAVKDRFWNGAPVTEIAHRAKIGRKTAERQMARSLRVIGETLQPHIDDFQTESTLSAHDRPRPGRARSGSLHEGDSGLAQAG